MGFVMIGLLFKGEVFERSREVSSGLARPQMHSIKMPKAKRAHTSTDEMSKYSDVMYSWKKKEDKTKQKTVVSTPAFCSVK